MLTIGGRLFSQPPGSRNWLAPNYSFADLKDGVLPIGTQEKSRKTSSVQKLFPFDSFRVPPLPARDKRFSMFANLGCFPGCSLSRFKILWRAFGTLASTSGLPDADKRAQVKTAAFGRISTTALWNIPCKN